MIFLKKSGWNIKWPEWSNFNQLCLSQVLGALFGYPSPLHLAWSQRFSLQIAEFNGETEIQCMQTSKFTLPKQLQTWTARPAFSGKTHVELQFESSLLVFWVSGICHVSISILQLCDQYIFMCSPVPCRMLTWGGVTNSVWRFTEALSGSF